MKALMSLAATGLLALPSTATAQDESEQTIRVLYNGYFIGLRVMKASVDADISETGYESEAVFRTAGVAGWFKDTEITATGVGVLTDNLLRPREYVHKNAASKKNRVVRIVSDETSVTPIIEPPFGSMGEPPATPEQRTGSFDWLVMFLNTSLSHSEEPCNRTVPVFDGKQRMDIRFELVKERDIRTRAYRGPGLICHVYYTPVAGFDQEDLGDPEDYARPLKIQLARSDNGTTIPVRIDARMSGVGIRVEAKSIEVSGENIILAQAKDADEI